jgi:hypothetical protein
MFTILILNQVKRPIGPSNVPIGLPFTILSIALSICLFDRRDRILSRSTSNFMSHILTSADLLKTGGLPLSYNSIRQITGLLKCEMPYYPCPYAGHALFCISKKSSNMDRPVPFHRFQRPRSSNKTRTNKNRARAPPLDPADSYIFKPSYHYSMSPAQQSLKQTN